MIPIAMRTKRFFDLVDHTLPQCLLLTYVTANVHIKPYMLKVDQILATTTNGDLLLSHFVLCKYDKPISEPSLGECEILVRFEILSSTVTRAFILLRIVLRYSLFRGCFITLPEPTIVYSSFTFAFPDHTIK